MTDKPKEERSSKEEFEKRYMKLCEETGFRISIKPVWIPRDDGSWSMVLQTGIGELPRKN